MHTGEIEDILRKYEGHPFEKMVERVLREGVSFIGEYVKSHD